MQWNGLLVAHQYMVETGTIQTVGGEMKTWGEFKKEVESQGVNDDSEIDWIDVGRFYRDEDDPPTPLVKVKLGENGIKIS